jgi:uncharacterized protein YjbI with pentapeptide repeats
MKGLAREAWFSAPFRTNKELSVIAILAVLFALVAGLPSNCVGCSFANRDLHGADLSNTKYVGASFAHADLRNASFRNAELAGASFRDADLRGADFSFAHLAGVDLRRAQIAGARFDTAELAGIDLRDVLGGVSDSDLRGLLHACAGCDLSGGNLAGRKLNGIAIPGGDLRNVRASGVQLAGADLEGVNFRSADLKNADLRNTRLCSYNTGGMGGAADRIGCATFQGADLHGADLRGASICENRRCTPLDAATLRAHAQSDLAGAILP